jgi:hypothetical protein
MRLDIGVSDADRAEQELLALCATCVRVKAEQLCGLHRPAGHPFCIVFGRHGTT